MNRKKNYRDKEYRPPRWIWIFILIGTITIPIVLIFLAGSKFNLTNAFLAAFSAFGGIVLILFGTYQIFKSYKSKIDKNIEKKPSDHRLFVIGIIFTGLNPYFFIWWLTVAAQLIIIAF